MTEEDSDIKSIAGSVLADVQAHLQAQSIAGSVLSGGNNSPGIISSSIQKVARGTASDDAIELAQEVISNNRARVLRKLGL